MLLPILFLILVIWIFSFILLGFFFLPVLLEIYQFYQSFQIISSLFHWFSLLFFCYQFHRFLKWSLLFTFSSLLWIYFYFFPPGFLKWELDIDLSLFLFSNLCITAINFHFSTVWLCPTNFNMLHFVCIWFSVSFFFISLETSSLTHGLFGNVLFSFQVFGDFSLIFLSLISLLIPLWWEHTCCIISSLLNFGRFILCLRIYSAHVECVLCYCVLCYRWGECSGSVASCWLMGIFAGCRVLCWHFSFQDSMTWMLDFFL